jgi:hypothetical protein
MQWEEFIAVDATVGSHAMSNNFDRREFGRRLTIGAAGAVPAASATAFVMAAGGDQQESAKPPAPAELVLELIKEQYPEHLTDERLALIRKDIDGILARSQALSSFPLANADEPAFVFSAFRSEGD